ncbi:MAG: hypothetical protein K2P20_02110 [Oscillospiraceae bacterium]|nr:hypothetical protein [Oscillospiraceae bacterium]
MEVRKEPGSVLRHSVSQEDLARINQLSKAELTPGQVYTFAVRLCDNEVDRDWERFDQTALAALGRLFEGKSGIFDHNWSAQGQTARLYKTEVCREEGVTLAGEPCQYLKGYAYMLRSEKNHALIEEIEAGIKKEVSIGCSVARRRCSICGEDGCGHKGGAEYGGQLCFFTLSEPTDAYEWSFVAVPAQRKAGVIKSLGQEAEGGLRRLLAGRPGYLRQLDQLEKEAQLGRSYLEGLRRELVRLAGLADGALDLEVFGQVAEKLEERELLEMSKAYRHRLDALYPPVPQLHGQGAAAPAEEDGAFLV